MTSLWTILLILLFPLPIGTDRKRRRVPWVTLTLITTNIVVFVITQSYSHTHPGSNIYGQYGYLPATPHLSTLFASLFLHVSVPHLFWNMAFLWLFGPHVEDALGPVPFLALYFGGGLAAGVLHTAIKYLIPAQRGTLSDPLVGASGAISAIIAPFAVRYHRAQLRLLWLPGGLVGNGLGKWEVPAIAGLGLWLLQTLAGAVYSLIKPSSGAVAYWAHLGGFAFGLIASELGGLLREGRQEYLLQEARHSATQGKGFLRDSFDKYEILLEQEPENIDLRMEYGKALAAVSPERAAAVMLVAIKLAQKQEKWKLALDIFSESVQSGVPLALSSRAYLRLASAAETLSERKTMETLLRQLIDKYSDSAEDEMARLKLGQFLIVNHRKEAQVVLETFIERYPNSAWAPKVRDLLKSLDRTYIN